MKIQRTAMITLFMLFLVINQVSARVLEGEVEIDWKSRSIFELTVTGGESASFNCDEVTDDNYQSYDKTLEAEVKYGGKRYNADVDIEWDDGHSFTIETESEDFSIDCDDVPSSYNTADVEYVFTFEVDTGEEDAVDDVIGRYLNYTTTIGEYSTKLATCEYEKNSNFEKFRSSEQECGSYKNEVVDQKLMLEENQKLVLELKDQYRNVSVESERYKSQSESCQATSQALRSERDTAQQEVQKAKSDGSQNFFIGAAIAGVIMYMVNRKESGEPQEVDELFGR